MLTVSVISPEAMVFEGPATSVVVPAHDGDLGILRDHAPLMSLLGKGTMRIASESGEKAFTIEGGFLQVAANNVRVVTERAVPAKP